MRTLLLTTAALAFVAIAPSMANPVSFNLSSSLGKTCNIAVAEGGGNLSLGPLAAATATGTFTTNCNFETSDMTLTFTSTEGGLRNATEGNVEKYNISFGAELFDSLEAQGGKAIVLSSGPVANNPVSRSFDVALQNDLTIGGLYSDVITVGVTQ